MHIRAVSPQLRTTDLDATIAFYTRLLGFELAFRYRDFYAGIRIGGQVIHVKRVDAPDPSIGFVAEGDHLHLYLEVDDVDAAAAQVAAAGMAFVKPLHATPWGTREFVFRDDQGHTIYVGQPA